MIAIFLKKDDQDEALVNIEYFLDFIFLTCLLQHDTNCSIKGSWTKRVVREWMY